MGLASPLPGRIQAQSEAWRGPPTFRVTSTFAEHVASGRGPGIDFGNGQCGAEVYACEAGTVSSFVDTGNGAVVVRINHGGGLVTGYAHLQRIEVSGQVARGQLIGHVGRTGADACHLHWGVNQNGVEVDGWPLLDQNILGDDMDPSFVAVGNRTLNLNAGTRHRTAPSLTAPIQIENPTAAPLGFPILGTVVGDAVNGNAIWYDYWRPETKNQLYIHSSTATITEFETVPGPVVPPVIIEVPSTEPPVTGVDPAPILLEVNKLTVALNDVSRARSRAVTIKNTIKTLAGG